MDVARRRAAALFAALIEMLYPPRCLLCGAPGMPGRDICPRCHDALPLIGAACTRCALPLPAAAQPGSREPVCGNCLAHPPHFDRSVSLARYDETVAGLVTRLKFRHRLQHARLLSQLLGEKIKRECAGAMPQAILPVPLHRTRLRQRGFNQSVELSRVLARDLRLPVLLDAVRRVRDTRSQTDFNRAERRRNIRGAFVAGSLAGVGHVAILDDVVTTASTVNELARVLKQAGVRRVDVWSVARAD